MLIFLDANGKPLFPIGVIVILLGFYFLTTTFLVLPLALMM